mgnify:CR=1 FL=1
MYKGFIEDVLNTRDTTSLNIVEPSGVKWGIARIELGTYRTQNDNHSTRPNALVNSTINVFNFFN